MKSKALIETLYDSFLGRIPDENGLNNKLVRLENGTSSVADILREILLSKEFFEKLPLFLNKFGIASVPFINSVSQFGETELLITHWLSNITNSPIVVDVGARGKERSNSWDLLKHFGWRGLLIEANSLLISQIEEDFLGLDYKIINCAVSDYEGEASFTLGINDDVSSLEPKMSEAWGKTKGVISVQVQKLSSILLREDIPNNFFLLSLDIEGEDVKVFNDLINNSMYRPSYVIIEASHDFSTKTLNDISVSEDVKKLYKIIGQTRANLILQLIG
jgi:FkbM family methyltransferase